MFSSFFALSRPHLLSTGLLLMVIAMHAAVPGGCSCGGSITGKLRDDILHSTILFGMPKQRGLKFPSAQPGTEPPRAGSKFSIMAVGGSDRSEKKSEGGMPDTPTLICELYPEHNLTPLAAPRRKTDSWSLKGARFLHAGIIFRQRRGGVSPYLPPCREGGLIDLKINWRGGCPGYPPPHFWELCIIARLYGLSGS